jgi:hypothetical protein
MEPMSEYLAKRLWDTIREDIADEDVHCVFVHDWRPYAGNPWLTVLEYHSAFRQEFAHWPEEYRHPFAAQIGYDGAAVDLLVDIESARYEAKIEEMRK